MASHKELARIPIQNEQYRLCFDRVTRDEEGNHQEYALVWRGTSVTPDGFVARPAYFSMVQLGQILREALKVLNEVEVATFLRSFADLSDHH